MINASHFLAAKFVSQYRKICSKQCEIFALITMQGLKPPHIYITGQKVKQQTMSYKSVVSSSVPAKDVPMQTMNKTVFESLSHDISLFKNFIVSVTNL